MIPVPSGVRIWIATGHTDMRRGMRSLALQVQQSFGRDPFAGDLYIFRVGLAPFHVGPHISWRHEPDFMAERADLAAPVVG